MVRCTEDDPLFLIERHLKLIRRSLDCLPSVYVGFQASRPTVLFFLLGSLDILGRLDTVVGDEEKKAMAEWIYEHHLKSTRRRNQEEGNGGSADHNNPLMDKSHVAQVYTALCCLLILGDDLSHVAVEEILADVAKCQLSDGSFSALPSHSSENDMRFVFCAVSVCYLLGRRFTSLDMPALCAFIRRSVNYDGGIGQAPTLESHGGSVYCAVASLAMLGRLWDYSVLDRHQLERLKAWVVAKQADGFHGRTNKPDDTCYSFWLGATLKILNAQSLIDETSVRRHLMQAQDERIGGFSKYEDSQSDLLHTFFSLAALSLLNEPGVEPVEAELSVTRRVKGRLETEVWGKL